MARVTKRPKHEIEIDAASGILAAMGERIDALERYWPPSRRGSNAQRALDAIKNARKAAMQCLKDAKL